MGKLNTYDVEINGVRTTIKLTEEQAKARGLIADKKAAAPANKKAPAPASRKRPDQDKS